MPNRREFLQAAAGALALGAWCPTGAAEESTPVSAQQPENAIDINTTLEEIACVLMGRNDVKNVEMHLVKKPSIGLTQWQWFHFNEGLTYADYAKVETVNGHLFDAMKVVHDEGSMGLDRLMLEGLVKGNMGNQVQGMWDTHYVMTEKLARRTSPFRAPDPEAVKRKMYQENYLRMRGTYTLQDKRNITLTPLSRLGAGYGLATQRDILFDPAEDPVIDRKAEAAQQKGRGPEFDEWVMRRRNEHFVQLIRENRRALTHLLVGADHDLCSDISLSNAKHAEQLSHIVVEVRGIRKEA